MFILNHNFFFQYLFKKIMKNFIFFFYLFFICFFSTMITYSFNIRKIDESFYYIFALDPNNINITKIYTLFSYIFLHKDYNHLLGNLIFFVPLSLLFYYENDKNYKEYIYFIFSSLFVTSFFYIWTADSPIIGLSECVFSFLGYQMSKSIFNKDFAFSAIILYIMSEQILSYLFRSYSSVSYTIHIYGFIFGLTYFIIKKYIKWK
jgi:membrane associated rhomboid family serine protease